MAPLRGAAPLPEAQPGGGAGDTDAALSLHLLARQGGLLGSRKQRHLQTKLWPGPRNVSRLNRAVRLNTNVLTSPLRAPGRLQSLVGSSAAGGTQRGEGAHGGNPAPSLCGPGK